MVFLEIFIADFFIKSDGGETFSFLLKFGKKSFSENSDGIITDRWHYLYV